VHVIHEAGSSAVIALGVGPLIEKIGSYAGFAAVIGLGVLAALYFSQARDVKRLRDWAGRAPERSAEVEAGGRTPEAAAVRTGQPSTVQRVAPAQRAAPAQPAPAQPAAAQPAAQPAKPADAKPQPHALPAVAAAAGTAATPAGAAASAAGAAPATATAAPPLAAPGSPATGAPTPAKTAPATAAAGAPAASPRPPPAARPGGSASPGTGGAKVLPARPLQPSRPPTIQRSASGNTAIIPPATARRERRWPAPRYLALIVAGVIILGLGGTVGVLALTGSDKKSASPGTAPGGSVALPSKQGGSGKSSHKKKAFAPAIDPKTVTVTVVNGTSVTGLARQMGTKVTGAGFVLGNLATASQQQRAESVVLYKPGDNRQARTVASKVGIAQIAPIDAQNSGLAGTAQVVVVVGSDKASGH
jgi:hypothetical protein